MHFNSFLVDLVLPVGQNPGVDVLVLHLVFLVVLVVELVEIVLVLEVLCFVAAVALVGLVVRRVLRSHARMPIVSLRRKRTSVLGLVHLWVMR